MGMEMLTFAGRVSFIIDEPKIATQTRGPCAASTRRAIHLIIGELVILVGHSKIILSSTIFCNQCACHGGVDAMI